MEIGLVDFVSEENEGVFFAETDDGFHCRDVQEGTGGVSGVDDDKCTSGDAVVVGFCESGFDFVEGGTPAIRFREVVWESNTVVLSESGGVEGVLRDGDQDTGLGRGDENVEQQGYTGRGTCGEEDVLGIAGEAITIWIERERD